MQKKRKSICFILIIILLIQVCTPMTSIGADVITASSDSRFQYTVNSDGTVMITKYVGKDTKVVIPSSLDGKSVTSIGYGAFDGCSSLASITIPEGVTNIGSCAFYSCSKLTSITIPEGVTNIGNQAFYGCSSLASITIPETVTSIGAYAFDGCSSLTSINIPEGVISIGEWAFSGCSSLTSIIIPASVTSIGYRAFYNCSSLTSINIPEGVTSIGAYAFDGCSSLTSIIIPFGVTSIGAYAFDEWSKLNIICKSNSTAHTYAVGRNISYTLDDEAPTIKYETNGNNTSAKTQGTKVTISDNLAGVEENNLKYLWSTSTQTPTEESFTESFTNGATISKNEGDGNWYLWILAKDKVGNVAIQKSNAFNIDNTAPTGTATYSPNTKTNQKVVATITANEEIQEVSGWTRSANKQRLTKEYKANGQETVTIRDIAGNKTQVPVNVNNIDKTAPVAKVKCSTTESTNQKVTVTITANEIIQPVSGWNLSQDKKTLTKTYIQNTVKYITIKDQAGNETQLQINVNNIDKTAPVTKVQYSTTEPTNQNVIVTITANEIIQPVSGWNLSQDKKTLTKTYTTNIYEHIIIKDLAGNETPGSISIFNIDTEKPTITYETNGNSTPAKTQGTKVTISDNITEIEESSLKYLWSISTEAPTEESFTESFTNGAIISRNEGDGNWYLWVLAKDKLGNVAIQKSNAFHLDNTAPTGTATYSPDTITNQKVVATITANEEIQAVNGWTLSANKQSLTKAYEVNANENITIKDIAGNEIQVPINVNNIDRTVPEAQVSYSTKELTNQNVTVTITANEKVQEIIGWKLSTNKQSLTKEYGENSQETVTIKDIAGNETQVPINIGNIDKDGPIVTYEINGNSTQAKTQGTKVTISDNIAGVEESSLKYLWSITNETPIEESFTESFTNGAIISKNEGNGNWYLWVLAKDKVGNAAIQKSNAFYLDNTAPTGTATYSPDTITNQKVVATITANEEIQAVNGWTLSANKQSLTKEYAENGQETITIKDIAGNETQVPINVNNIDKTAPEAQVSYSTKELTNQNVTVTITANEKVQEISGWTLSANKQSLTKEYRANGQETITIKDIAGNETQVPVNVNNIDKTAPKITGVEEGKTYTKVTPQVRDENLSTIKLTKDEKQITYQNGQEIKEKGKYVLIAQDKAGNKTTVHFTIIEKINTTEININKYEIKGNYITNIKAGTNVVQLKSNIQSNVGYEIQTKAGEKVGDNGVVGTGMKIVFATGENYTLVVKGDTNGDGKVSITDLTKIKKHIIGQAKLESEYEIAGDLNASSSITVTDLAQIKKAIVGLIQL